MRKQLHKLTFIAISFIATNLYAQTGNVGIGTNTPQAKFHVNGEIRIDSLKTNADANQVLVVDTLTKNIALLPYSNIVGDAKQGFQAADHEGWILLTVEQ